MYGTYFTENYDPIHAVSILVSEMPVSALQKASTILIGSGNKKVFLMYQADKSQKIRALDTAEFKGPQYEGSPGIPF